MLSTITRRTIWGLAGFGLVAVAAATLAADGAWSDALAGGRCRPRPPGSMPPSGSGSSGQDAGGRPTDDSVETGKGATPVTGDDAGLDGSTARTAAGEDKERRDVESVDLADEVLSDMVERTEDEALRAYIAAARRRAMRGVEAVR